MAGKKRLIGPVIEPVGTPRAVITRPAIELILEGDFNDVPCIFGYNADEGLGITTSPEKIPDMQTWNCTDAVPYLMQLNPMSELVTELGKDIRNKYFGSKNLTDGFFKVGPQNTV